ncbi:HEAT repeat domain-containing protein [Planctomicrobium sp. SH664]|uniref:HEAT repeat domain-containing protein n=1 Tax=Planctomicrobium sp. SH664 TaxID=3448125 RepID=UPI003F5C6749
MTKELKDALQLQGTWVSIHAADALLQLGELQTVWNAFEAQQETSEPRYRIGVWRTLAKSAPTDSQRAKFVGRIQEVLRDDQATDQLHAVEALAKLRLPIAQEDREVVQRMAFSSTDAGAPFALWCLMNSGDATAADQLVACITSPLPVARARAAYVLWQRGEVTDERRGAIEQQLSSESDDSPAKVMLTAALGGESALKLAQEGTTAGARSMGAMAIVGNQSQAARDALENLMKDPDQDLRVAAAFAWLKNFSKSAVPAGVTTR